MSELTGMLILDRFGKDNEGYERGYLKDISTGKMFSTRERGNGYVSLRRGNYLMKHSIKNTGRRIQCLRPVESSIQTILIHDAYNDNPKTLEGCIAPGIMTGSDIVSWKDSHLVMEELWNLLGGFKEGNFVILVVAGNVSYVSQTETRNDWSRLKGNSFSLDLMSDKSL